MEFLHMPKELNGLSDRVLFILVPNGEEFSCRWGQEDRAVEEAWGGEGLAEWKMWSNLGRDILIDNNFLLPILPSRCNQ